MNMRDQWRALSALEKYKVAMFFILFVWPALVLAGFLAVVVYQVMAR